MSIQGNLETMELAELLQWLEQGRKTGELRIDNGRVEKKLSFDKGVIVATASSDPKEYLGHFLVSHGYLDEDMLAKAMEMQEENRMLLGKILVTIGALAEQDLNRMLQLKAEESIYDIFTWSEGEFSFLEEAEPAFQMVPLALKVTRLTMEGHRRLDEWKLIRKKIASAEGVPVVVGELRADPDDPGAAAILAMVNDDRTIREIVWETHSSEFYVCRVLYGQMAAGRLKIVRPRVARAVGPAPEGAPPPPAKAKTAEAPGAARLAAAGGVNPEDLLGTARHHVDRREYDVALRHLQAARSLDPNHRGLQKGTAELEERIDREIGEDGVTLESVPQLAADLTDPTALDISPQEGFVLTRINGTYDVKTILKISPMPALDARVVVWKLLDAGHIRIA